MELVVLSETFAHSLQAIPRIWYFIYRDNNLLITTTDGALLMKHVNIDAM